MAIPATSGIMRNNLADMQIGDYIPCTYTATTSGAVGTFSNLGVNNGTEIPVESSATPSGAFYFIKVDRGLLIADRVIQQSISWDTLNAGQFIEGKKLNLGQEVLIRSLSGGCAYADANGSSSINNKSLGGFPVNNEWDKYITNSSLSDRIIKGDDNVWHWSNIYSLCKETTITSLVEDITGTTATNTHRALRGVQSANRYHGGSSSGVWSVAGFRPALEYLEPNAKATTLFY